MTNLKRAHQELFRRSDDERFASLDLLLLHCLEENQRSQDRWHLPGKLLPKVEEGHLVLQAGTDGSFLMNDWSFSQLCGLAGVSKDTLNRLSLPTAAQAFRETIPIRDKPLQLLTDGQQLRSIHGTQYSRLWNSDLLTMLREYATDFEPPPQGFNGGTGLYCGEQDMFCFLIDPTGWTEINGQNFAPGFFVWNSEVGRRSLGIETFWFQSVCQNHIVWDACEVIEFTRKHTGNVAESLDDIRRIIEQLVQKRDARQESFAKVVSKAMSERVASDDEEAEKFLFKYGIPRQFVKAAIVKISEQGKMFTLWNLIDELTQLNGEIRFAGSRTEADSKVSELLALAL